MNTAKQLAYQRFLPDKKQALILSHKTSYQRSSTHLLNNLSPTHETTPNNPLTTPPYTLSQHSSTT